MLSEEEFSEVSQILFTQIQLLACQMNVFLGAALCVCTRVCVCAHVCVCARMCVCMWYHDGKFCVKQLFCICSLFVCLFLS